MPEAGAAGYGLRVRSLVMTTALFLVSAPAVVGQPSSPGGTGSAAPVVRLVGGDACQLIEGLPEPTDPVRKAKPFRKAFRVFEKAGLHRKKLRKAYAAFDKTLDKLLQKARAVFDPVGGPVARKPAARFLEQYVLTKRPALQIGPERFEPVAGVRAAFVFSACMSGNRDAAIAIARRARGKDEARMTAWAALLLLEADRRAEATELLQRFESRGFLAPWVRAELATDAEKRQLAHRAAAARAVTPAQQAAVQSQATRLGF